MYALSLIIVPFCVLPTIHSSNNTDEILISSRTNTFIVGGEEAPIDAAPFQCSLQESKIHLCGCSVISNKWILTASHCVFGLNAGSLEILVGTNDLTSGGTYYKVERFITHEKFRKYLLANDIAVIRVQGKIEFNNRVQPIEPSPEEMANGASLTLTGWGDLKRGGEHPKHLQMIRLKAMSTDSCRKTIILRFVLHPSHMCTFTKAGEGACFGDSGGPLVYMNEKGKIVQVGIVNFGWPCARGFPDVFAKISYLYDWIKEHTKEIF